MKTKNEELKIAFVRAMHNLILMQEQCTSKKDIMRLYHIKDNLQRFYNSKNNY